MGASVLLMVAMFGVFYVMLIRPQQKRQQAHAAMLRDLKKGDQVVTTGGIIGKISGITDQVVVIEVQDKVRMRILRSHIQDKHQAAEASASAEVSAKA